MDLLLKALIIAIVAIVIAAGAFILLQKVTSSSVTKAQAVQFVISDIKAHNQTANVSIINVSNSSAQKHSWNIIVAVVYNKERPCPIFQVESFDYPATGSQNQTDIPYTSYTGGTCVIYGLSDAPSYVISSPEIAIANSYISNYSTIRNYVNWFGYSNINVTAQFLVTNATSTNSSLTNVWQIDYKASDANYSEDVIMSTSGSIINTYNRTTV